MHSFKSQSLDSRSVENSKQNLCQNSVFLYLRDRKLRNKKQKDSSVRQALSASHGSFRPQALRQAISKKQATSEDKYDLLLQLLLAKIKVLADYTRTLETKIRTVSNNFSSAYSEYCECPSSRQTATLMGRLRQQLITNLPPDKSIVLVKELEDKVQEARDKFGEMMEGVTEKAAFEKERLKTQLERERQQSQSRLQSSIQALSYNNRIMGKLQKQDHHQIRTQLNKYQQLKKRHFDLVTENERIKAVTLMQRLMSTMHSTNSTNKPTNEEHDTTTDSLLID